MFVKTGVNKCGSPNRYKRKDEWNESCGEKNRGPAYVSRFVTYSGYRDRASDYIIFVPGTCIIWILNYDRKRCHRCCQGVNFCGFL